MARKKSIDDINTQANRLRSEIIRRNEARGTDYRNDPRYNQVKAAQYRYSNNLLNTPSAQRDRAIFNNPLTHYDKAIDVANKLYGRKYSRSTYMGAANG